DHGAHVLGTGRWRVNAGNNGGAGGCANGSIRAGAGVAQGFFQVINNYDIIYKITNYQTFPYYGGNH
ncbi:MAG: hypothetical protein AAF195_03575, partial [Pseudomonadota bacterium]